MEPSRQSLLHEQSGKKGTADSVMTHEPVVKPLFFVHHLCFFTSRILSSACFKYLVVILSLDEERDRIVIFRGVRTVRHTYIFPVQNDLDDRRNQILFTIDEVESISQLETYTFAYCALFFN